MNRKKQLDNRGSAIVTVIVVITFITILATIMLFTSTANYQMKSIDYSNKKSFYEGEEVLEQLKTAVIKDVAEAYTKAYEKVIVDYARYNEPGAASGERENLFKKYFVEELQALYGNRVAAAGGDLKVAVQNMVPVNGAAITAVSTVEYNTVDGYAIIRGIQVHYTDGGGFTTMISTDVYMEAPVWTWDAQELSSTDWEAGIDPSDLNATGAAVKKASVNYSDCVVYLNWEKQ